MQDLECDVLVVGAGPVGLTLAMDLVSRGAKVTVAEIRRYAEPPNVKCNHVAARTMERFRRLGVAQKLRDAGLPADYPNDVVFRTSVRGEELTRIPIPCRADRYTSKEGPDTWWPTPEPPHRINQLFLEPILLEHTAALPGVTLLNRTQVTSFAQSGTGVEAVAFDLDTQQERRIRARYLVGCDGGSSTVRKAMGAKLEGTPVIQRVQSTYIRAPQLKAMIPGKPAWCYYSVNPRRCGTVFAIDGHATWLVHNHLNPNEPEFDSIDRDWSIRQILGVDEAFQYDVISKEDWVGRRLVANRFRDKRVFIAGDAAHLWVPYAGYGMNAGIADALNLSWLLGAQLQGWAEEAILDAYEAERQPITEQVSRFAMEHAAEMIKARRAVPANIEAQDADGERARRSTGQEAYDLNVQQFCCAGLNFGYFYEGSPIIVGEGEAPPAYSMGGFTESTVPGCRAPHFWLADGRSLYDAFGQGYTLLRFDPQLDVGPLVEAARARHLPLTVLDLAREDAPAAYRHKLVLCREDQHVAWRADAAPADAAPLVDVLRGGSRIRTHDRLGPYSL
jgi:2-polyprenyl-6-methoxyphenol hydroxylase-like FAD-dependent oxidoreductase